jgi:hypothetical protein
MASAVKRGDQLADMIAWNATIAANGGASTSLPTRISPRVVSTLLKALITQALAAGGSGMVVSDIPTVVDDRRFGELKARLDALVAST